MCHAGGKKLPPVGDYYDRWVVRSEKGQQSGMLRGNVKWDGVAWKGKEKGCV